MKDPDWSRQIAEPMHTGLFVLDISLANSYERGGWFVFEKRSASFVETPELNNGVLPSHTSLPQAVTPTDQIPNPRIIMLNDNEHWVPAIDPVHTDNSAAGVGLCRSFARELTKNDESITIGLIPCAFGGTPLERWQSGGDLYERAVKRTKNAMRDGRLRGILWHQGERDSRFEDMARTYGDRLEQMVTAMRRDLGLTDLPVVVGMLGEFVVENPIYPHAEIVNKALAELPNRLDNTACVQPIGLGHKGDQAHFSREALESLGLKYARAITQLQLGETASATDNNQ